MLGKKDGSGPEESFVQVGIASWGGYFCADPRYPGVYTRYFNNCLKEQIIWKYFVTNILTSLVHSQDKFCCRFHYRDCL